MFIFLVLLFSQLTPGGDRIKLSYKEYRFGDGILRVREEKKILIETKEAREEFGTLVFPYDDSIETIEILYARTITPEGDTINVTENAINRVADPIVEAYPFLKNRRELHISFLSLRPGSIIEYCIERKVKNLEYVDGIEYFRGTLPIDYSKLVFYFPQKLGLRFCKGNTEVYSFSESLRDSADYKIYEVEFKELPEIVRNEWRGYPPRHLISPYVIFTTFPTWDSLAHYLTFHYKRLETIKPGKLDLYKLRELSEKIKSPERESFNVQGYVPLDRNRSASLYLMTYPEEILRLVSSFEGLSVAFVLRYGFDTSNVISSLATIENIILYDGSSFLFPFRGEKKILSNPYEDHFAIVLSRDSNSYSVKKIEVREALSETLIVDIPKKLISFSNWIPSYRLLRSFSSSLRDEEDFENVENFVSRSKYSVYGVIKDFKASLKYREKVDKPYLISGKIRYRSIGSQIGKYLILYIPEIHKIDPELYKNGYYLNPWNVFRKEVCFVIKVPKGYKIRYIPQRVSYEDGRISIGRELDIKDNRVVLRERMVFLKRYLRCDELEEIAKEPEFSDLASPHVIIFERKR